MKTVVVLFALSTVLLSPAAVAQDPAGTVAPHETLTGASSLPAVPRRLSYQGVLSESSGAPVDDGDYDFTVELFTVSSGGAPAWSDNFTVAVEHGTFTIILGSGSPLDVIFDKTYWVQVTVTDGPAGPTYPEILVPRTELTSAPYSLGPWATAGPNDIHFGSGNVGIGTNFPGTKLDVSGAISARGVAAPGVSPAGQGRLYFDNTANKFKVSENGGGYTDLVGGGSSQWTTSGSDIYYSGGHVGIGGTLVGSPAPGSVSWNLEVTRNLAVLGSDAMNVASFNTRNTTSGAWWHITHRGTGTVGFLDNLEFHVRPTGVESDAITPLALTANGRVGIGTTSPGSKLVIHTGTDGDGVHVAATSGVGVGYILSHTFESSSAQLGLAGGGGSWIPTSVSGDLIIDNDQAYGLLLGTNNTERMRISGAGNVGIGTTTPDQKLSLSGMLGINPSTWVSPTTRGLFLHHTGAGAQIYAFDYANPDYNGDPLALTAEKISFGTYNMSGTLDDRMTITNNGSVGIGTTTPGAGGIGSLKLEIADETGSNSDVAMRVAGGGYPVLHLASSNGTLGTPTASADLDYAGVIYFNGYSGDAYKGVANIGAQVIGTPAGGNNIAGRLLFMTRSYGSVYSETRMAVADNGNVGIGTLTPGTSNLLELSSTTKGLVLSRMTKAERDAIATPVAGMMIYQTDNTPGLRVYNGSNWMRFTETAD